MRKHQGEVRLSQLLNVYGPGALVDLPRHSAVVSGIDFWVGDKRRIHEERLSLKVAAALGRRDAVPLLEPPIQRDREDAEPAGIPVFQFPEWFVAQVPARRRPLVHLSRLEKGKYEADDRRKVPVVPVRFVQACILGHLSDIDWYRFIHEEATECRRDLWMEERGSSGDLTDVVVGCACGRERSMARATVRGRDTLGFCSGSRPWLGRDGRERCGGKEGKPQPARLLIRSASDAYFPQILRVISIPDREQTVRQAVSALWDDFLQFVEAPGALAGERKRPKVAAALAGLKDEEVWSEIQERKGGGPGSGGRKVKEAELATLLATEQETGEDVPEGADFHARRLPLPSPRVGALAKVDRVVLVNRLREVAALVGFTRFESQAPDIDGEISLDVKTAPLAETTSWVPAVENRGEGVFLSLDAAAVKAWLARPAVKERGERLARAFQQWKERRQDRKSDFPGLPYVLLHSLSHLLLTAVALDCGYAVSSIRERIYVGEGAYGILLYTATPDAEGTLGGLVEVGRRLDTHLGRALALGRLCSNDPICAQHAPEDVQEERFLHGAACHGCLLIAETTCERRNDFLDRALVVPTVDGAGAELFGDEGETP